MGLNKAHCLKGKCMPQPKKPEFKIDFHRPRTFYKKGAVIFKEDDLCDNAYIIEHGEVEISTLRQGRTVPLVRLGEGEVFGETALLGGGKRTAQAVAIKDTEVFLISPRLLSDRIMRLDPLVGLLMSLLVNRYRQWRHKAPDEAAPLVQDEENILVNKADEFLRDMQKQREVALGELRMAQEIARAIEERQFIPFLQPIVSLPDQKLLGFEALIRWQHPSRRVISPAEFVPVAERTHIVQDLDRMMLERACMIVKDLQNAAGNPERGIYVSVNLSGAHFNSETVVEEVADILKKHATDPAHIVLEITESALMGDPAVAAKVLADLKKLGLRIALDDFGTGYSSLSYLHHFSLDILKIDRSFVHDIENNKKSMDIVRAIVTLAKTFDLKIVIEGIEQAAGIAPLAGMGCDAGQGYLFSKPLPLDKAIAFVRESIGKNG